MGSLTASYQTPETKVSEILWIHRTTETTIETSTVFEFEVEFFQEMSIRGLYPKAALLSHECVGNTFISLDETRSLRIYSSIDVDAGKTIYNNYTFALALSVSFPLSLLN